MARSMRLVDYCIGLFELLPTKNAVKKAIKRGILWHNGEIARTGSWVSEGDVIELHENIAIPKAFPLEISLVFEDEYFAVVNKPGGLPVSGNAYRTLENALVNQLRQSSEKDAYKWAKPVHRIDAATCGLVLFAKTISVHHKLSKLFEDRKIEKEYVAILSGAIENQKIESSIDNKSAISLVDVISKVPSLLNKELSLVNLKPLTGRTHQLRIHCAEVGHPIVGDKIYAGNENTFRHKGLFLQANKLSFSHPINGKIVSFQLEIPPKFNSLMNREERRWKKYN